MTARKQVLDLLEKKRSIRNSIAVSNPNCIKACILLSEIKSRLTLSDLNTIVEILIQGTKANWRCSTNGDKSEVALYCSLESIKCVIY